MRYLLFLLFFLGLLLPPAAAQGQKIPNSIGLTNQPMPYFIFTQHAQTIEGESFMADWLEILQYLNLPIIDGLSLRVGPSSLRVYFLSR